MKTVSKLKTAILYAEAMYDGAQKAGDLDALYNDARRLATLSTDAATQVNALNSPLITLENKIKVLKTMAEQLNFAASTNNTLKILAQNNKLNLLQIIFAQFVALYQERHNIAEVEVTSAVELQPAQDAKLKDKLEKIFAKDILVN